jgi:hypothetical protein
LTSAILYQIFSYLQENTCLNPRGITYAYLVSADGGATALSASLAGDEHESAAGQAGAAALLHLFAV